MKKLIITLLIFLLPAMVFLTVWQAYRYDMLSSEVAGLEASQKDLFEKNKKIVMGIEFLKSPFRVDGIAENKLDLEKINPGRIIRVLISPAGGRGNG